MRAGKYSSGVAARAAQRRTSRWLRAMLAVVVTAGSFDLALAQVSNISATRHNLSAANTTVQNRASTETEICVFCHTPHGSVTAAPAPLWNRAIDSGAGYVPYTSTSLDAEYIGGVLGAPGASSKLCLSCHDGTLAIGQVSNAPGSGVGVLPPSDNIAMTAGAGSPIGAGAGATTGFTRRLGSDLRNDHPISVTYNSTLATRDGELRTPPYSSGATLIVDNRTPSTKRPKLPLDAANQVQCSTCHEPHYTEPKFLRGKRLQASPALGGDYRDQIDQICLACHDKLGLSWANSAHAKGTAGGGGLDVNPGNVVYVTGTATTGATVREFPAGTMVWQAGCLNCHDTHTVQGAKRLLREGTDSTAVPKTGGSPAQEQVCYSCHAPSASSAVTVGILSATAGVPDIRTEFTTRAVRMPIASTDQPAGSEVHEIGFNASETYKNATVDCTTANNECGADFMENRGRLGATDGGGTHTNRHVECTDCHNPHRVIKNALFNGAGSNTRRTHAPGGAAGNIASGALRGTWGVEPSYQSTVVATTPWPVVPDTYAVKRGDPPVSASTAKGSTYLTREYQLCFKCHSDYGAGPAMPTFGNHTIGRTSTTSSNGFTTTTRWTNVAAEYMGFNAADTLASNTDQGEAGACTSGCPANYTGIEPAGSLPADTGEGGIMTALAGTQNHRSWHPVVFPTGRSHAERRIGDTANANFRTPFNGTTAPDGLGLQTMTCSDCHGAGGTWTAGTGPTLTTVQGPHGSGNPFLLRGTWSTATTIGATGLCGNCHSPSAGTEGVSDAGAGRTSGFNAAAVDGAGGHGNAHASGPCMRCHVAVPHGWKNKALLVNLNCVGPEAGQASTCVSVGNGPYNNAPYYNSAYLRVRTWVPSGNWAATSCGFASAGAGGQSGKAWMKDNAGCDLP